METYPGDQALVESLEASAFGRFANRCPERVLPVRCHVRLEDLERLTERGPVMIISESVVNVPIPSEGVYRRVGDANRASSERGGEARRED